MKRNAARLLLVLLMMLSLCFLCTACGGDTESAESTGSAESGAISPEDDPNEGLGGAFPPSDEEVQDGVYDYLVYEGLWMGDSDAGNQYDPIYIEFDAEGNWHLYMEDGVADDGYLLYEPDQDAIYVVSSRTGAIDGGRVELEDDQLYITTLGYFVKSPSEDLEGSQDSAYDFLAYEGVWIGDSDTGNQYDNVYIEFNASGYWHLYIEGDEVDDGYLLYEPQWDAIYTASSRDGAIGGGRVELEGDQLYITTCGYFEKAPNEDDAPVQNNSGIGNGNEYYSWNSELHQRNISELRGVWYYDEDLSAETYIIIDDSGTWHYFQRSPGVEAEEMDYGTFSYSPDEDSTYYANSSKYDGASIRVFDFADDMLVWGDEGTYYWMEDWE